MPKIIIHQEKIKDPQVLIDLCPFNAMEIVDGKLQINAACKLCKICVKKGPEGACEYYEEQAPLIDKSLWKGITVYVEHLAGDIHPVTFELIGKAIQLAEKIKHPVYALFIGYNITAKAEQLLHYGVDNVFVYDYKELEYYRIEPFAACFEDFINKNKPSTILVGGTTIGRSLAPRVAARFHTGLTADCTMLEMQENTDLDQIRPAFGGNIMAHIRTPNNRPQFATVRYKIFGRPDSCDINDNAKITKCEIKKDKLMSKIKVLDTKPKQTVKHIEEADIVVAGGRGLKKPEDYDLIKRLAEVLDGQYASSRPLVEAGWVESRRQIGLSGRTVKPKVIITCGVSGSIQFKAGMQNSDTIIAINTDENAPIFSVATYCVIGDLYKILPILESKIRAYKKLTCN
jgi:electron transfer flavoprotein alpha subunit